MYGDYMNIDIMNSVEKNDVISFVGGGGKTSMMFNIAFAAKKLGLKVLVTTTTKIFVPEKHCYDKIVLRETISRDDMVVTHGITVLGGNVINGKIIALNENELHEFIKKSKFDLVLIEADGSRRKSLKAYKEHEPAVPIYSNKVFAVISLDSIGTNIDERYVYNSKRVSEILSKEYGSIITSEDIINLVESEQGLFEKMQSKSKFLILTKCVNKERKDQFDFIVARLREVDDSIKVFQNY